MCINKIALSIKDVNHFRELRIIVRSLAHLERD
jgi:hypothetical protein